MRYLVRAQPRMGELASFWTALNNGSIERQEPDGKEIVASMKRAVMARNGVEWDETCYCTPPLRHERSTVYDQFFDHMKIEPVTSLLHLHGGSFWDYIRVMDNKKQLCYHLVAQQIAEAMGRFDDNIMSDSQYSEVTSTWSARTSSGRS